MSGYLVTVSTTDHEVYTLPDVRNVEATDKWLEITFKNGSKKLFNERVVDEVSIDHQ